MEDVSPDAGAVVVSAEEFLDLVRGALDRLGIDAEDADAAAYHFSEAEIRDRGGVERLLALARLLERSKIAPAGPIEVIRESAHNALIRGGGHLGYAVAARATDLAIEKAQTTGVGIVAANDHRFSGVVGLYAERVARAGLVAMAVASANSAIVAPYGGRKARLGTNPIAFAFPTAEEPVVWDIATSSVPGTLLHEAAALGFPLPEGVAIDAAGEPTRDGTAAKAGALLAWGGHKGAGLSVVIQLLGLLCDIPAEPAAVDEWEAGFLIVAIDPAGFLPAGVFEHRAAAFTRALRETPAAGSEPVRAPGDRSLGERKRRLAGRIPLDADTYALIEGFGR